MENTNLPINKYLPFYNNLSEDEKSDVEKSIKTMNFKKGENIHDASHECLGMLYIKSGTLRTYMLSDEGKEITLYRINSGEICILAASCVLKYITFDVFIDAEEDCEILQLSASCLSKLMKNNIHVECFVYKTTTERFSDVMWAMQQILFMSFDRRLATFLLDESRRTQNSTVFLTHEQIAKYIGSAREVVTRMLKYFADEGLVELKRGSVKIIDRETLNSLI